MEGSTAKSMLSSSKLQTIGPQFPTCPVCMEKLGTYDGPSSLPCGHNGCLQCLQQVQALSSTPLCPLCRTPFDAELSLGPNFDFKEMLESLHLASSRSFQINETSSYDNHDQDVNIRAPALFSRNQTMKNFDKSSHSDGMGPFDGTVHTGTNVCNILEVSKPDVNIWNVIMGSLSLISRKAQSFTRHQNLDTGLSAGPSSRSDTEVGDELWTSMTFPSAPPLYSDVREDITVMAAILDSEPPQWIPDSGCNSCMQCGAKFQPLRCGRHHCRFCGGIFCNNCSKGKCLMPAKFREKNPQRVCDSCYERLEPVQQILVGSISNAAQIAVHDVTDITCVRGWLNNPCGSCMENEIYKATNTLKTFCKIGRLKPEQSIPDAILHGAQGLAVLTVAKVGMVMTYKLGTGIIVARREDGSWSPPSAIISGGLGWGLQAGGELIDFVIVLSSSKAVKAFSGRVHLSFGAGISLSAGPLGRHAEADLCIGNNGVGACYTYSCCQGAFAGVSFEGNVVASRPNINARFYGDTYLTNDDILFGSIQRPRAATPLYIALDDLFSFTKE